jgi:hypothetical protein
MEFQKSLQEKLGEHKPTEVDELILDDLYTNLIEFTTDHKKTLELYNNLLHLSLNGLGLKSLKNFPKIPELRILEIRHNNLNGVDFKELMNLYPQLYKLKVGENPVKSLDVFKPFISYPSLKKLELIDTEVTKKETYRDELFKLLKDVEVIDKMNREGDEIDSTIYDEEGDEFEEDDFEGDEDFEDEEDIDDDEEDFDDEDDDDEEDYSKNKNGKKPRRE